MENYKQLFVGGDLSGIQKFLYNISSKRAAVSLKGRSWYLREYTEDVCNKLADAVKLAGATSVDVIYCSGGKFYFLTENGSTIIEAIDRCAKAVKKDLWKEHLGQLGINIAYVSFSENADGTVNTNGKLNLKPGELWRTVNAEFARQKNQKFKDIISEQFLQFFRPIPVGGKVRVCAITGIESPDCVKLERDSDEDEDIMVLPSVKKQMLLGQRLRNVQGFKSFEDYADNTYLGILRMDVDGLGKRFIEGFDSIAQYRLFSNRLVNFFEKEVEVIQHDSEYRTFLNIIYAGGDDLFIVGRWDKLIDFAERIHQETVSRFKADGISISGGVVMVKPKFPIAKAAELAGEAEDAAKHFRDEKKNAFCLFGKTVSWENEFDYVKDFKDEFVRMISTFGISKSILHKIMLYASMAELNKKRKKKGQAEDFSYMWHISYYMTRYMERYKTNAEVCTFCRNLRDRELTSNSGRNLELIGLAARWAELLLRDQNKQ
jgi:CRISPR/Cas system-associated protein Cas10 (large subunit of type III CRISPR-Cas system)